MSRFIPVRFVATRAVGRGEAPRHEVIGAAGEIRLRGAISLGTGGLALSATAHLHRRRISLYVTARPSGEEIAPQLEDHDYEATFMDLTPGRYYVRVTHLVLGMAAGACADGMQAYESSVRVG